MSYVSQGTRFDLTRSQFDRTKKEERRRRFSVIKSLLRYLHNYLMKTTTSVWILAGVACLHLTQTWYVSCKWKQTKTRYSHYIKSLPSRLYFSSLYFTREQISPVNMFGKTLPVKTSNVKSKPQMSDRLFPVFAESWSTVYWSNALVKRTRK